MRNYLLTTMANKDRRDLEKLTVRALRSQAQHEVGRGYSKLRTKAQLVEALVRRTVQNSKATLSAVVADLKHTASTARRPAPVRRDPEAKVRTKPVGERTAKPSPSVAPGVVRGERQREAARPLPTPRSSAALPPPAEPLLALPVDGKTLFVRWGRAVAAQAGGRFALEVTSEGKLVRTVEVPVGARQAYVAELPADGPLLVSLLALAVDGTRTVVGRPSRPVVLLRASARAASRKFVRFSWAQPEASAQRPSLAPPGQSTTALTAARPGTLAGAGTVPRTAASAATSPRGVAGWRLASATSPTSFRR